MPTWPGVQMRSPGCAWSRDTLVPTEPWAPDVRGRGVARALIEAVADWARERKCPRVYWQTQESNATARALYDTLADRPGFIQYRRLF